MSKRAAQVQGGKDLPGGFGNEMSANSADTFKRATAAQLASRNAPVYLVLRGPPFTRIWSAFLLPFQELKALSESPKFPKTSSLSPQMLRPFSAIDPNIVPPTSSTTTNGFSFGQAQSFPQTSSGTGTTTTPQSSFFGDQNNSGPKLFGSQAGSAPSSFSFMPAATQEIKNPFASMPSGFGQSQGSAGGFQGFQGNTFNIPGTATNQDTQNKAGQQAPTGGIFGSSQPPQQTPFTFGASSAPKSVSLFSAAPPVSTPTSTSAPIFGQSTGSNIFGASAPATNIFGATSQANKPSDEMQMSPPAKNNGTGENRASQFGISQPSFTSSTTQPSIFETSAFKPAAPATPSTSQPFSSSIFNTTPSSGTTLFGAMKKPDETPKPTSSSTAPATFSFTSSTAPGSSIFGQASKPEDKAATAITTTSSGPSFSTSFPAPAPAPAPAAFNLFGTSANPKEPSPAPSATEDRVSSTKSPVPEPPTTPGTSLFGHIAKPPEESQASSAPAPEAEKAPTESPSIAPAATPSATPFPSTPSGGTSLFGRARKPTETSQPTSIFNTPATSTTPSAPTFSFTPSSTSIFQTPANAASTTSDGEKTKEGVQSATGLFQTKAATDTTPSSISKPFSSLSQAQQPPSNLFGSTPSPSLFKSSAGPEKAPSTPQASSTALPEKFTPTTTPKPFFAGISNGVGGTTKAMDTAPTKALAPMKRKEPLTPKSRLASYGPPAIPRELNNDERAEFDTQWRLNALNASFQKRVAEADPKSDDIDVLVEFYVRVRENIGVPTGLAMVPKAGKKRKAVEEDGHIAEDFSRNKRTKGLPTFTSQHETDAASVSSSPAAVGGSSSFGEKSASASANFSSTASPFGKRKMTDIEDDASSRSEPGNGNGKRPKSTGESTAGASSLQKSSTNSEKKKSDNGDTGSGSGMSAASDTVTMFATSFVSQSQREKSPVGFPAPFSSLSSTQDSAEGTATASDSSQGSESENDTVSNASAGEEDGEGEEEESESSATPPATSNGGRSLFDRVELDRSGKPVRHEVPETEDKVATPSPGDKDSNSNVSSLFTGSKFASSFNSPASIGTPQFSNGFDFKSPRALSPINPSPGASDAKSPPVIFPSSTGTSTPTAPAVSTTTSTLFPKATSSLLPNGSAQLSPFPLSAGTSADVSRATTPNLSETGAEEREETAEDLPQVDLLRGGTGEEDEDEVFEARVKTLKLGVPPDADDETPKWLLQGVGLLRILKHKTTGRARILVRADPSGRVLLNTNLAAAVSYKSVGSAVQFLVLQEPKPEQWIARVKKEDIAVELAKVMEKYKT
ncbi:hypothetical protein EMPG_09642 [Blastomyces silverae]|uniref:RanBD1 domain-containing protein n=1 Tax=Blastomyces silverae TaxID=2060906 RepID=A0A0H1BRE2_9EURO|nr:hypothetical protein EMPG_09642 [Blastomyces silverae]